MKQNFTSLFSYSLFFLIFTSCATNSPQKLDFVYGEKLIKNNSGIRAIKVVGDSIFYAGKDNQVGFWNYKTGDDIPAPIPSDEKRSFRAVAYQAPYFYVASIESPTEIFRKTAFTEWEKVYTDLHPKAFINSLAFNKNEGWALGDATDLCLTILHTKNGKDWEKIACEELPTYEQGEVAFAASNSNISLIENKVFFVTGGKVSRLIEFDGLHWKAKKLPVIQGKATQGVYSMHFYNDKIGIAIGGDYMQPKSTIDNIIITKDGGKTWSVLDEEDSPSYRSSIRFFPNSKGEKLIAVGTQGISYSLNSGKTWRFINNNQYYTLRFIDDENAVVAGNNGLQLIRFKSY